MSALLPAGVLRTIRQYAEDPAGWFGSAPDAAARRRTGVKNGVRYRP